MGSNEIVKHLIIAGIALSFTACGDDEPTHNSKVTSAVKQNPNKSHGEFLKSLKNLNRLNRVDDDIMFATVCEGDDICQN